MPSNIKKSLLITLDFPPSYGGVATYYHHICKNLPSDKVVVVAPEHPKAKIFDQTQRYAIIRKNLANNLAKPKLLKIFDTLKWMSAIKFLTEIIKNHDIELLQVGQILPLGTVALALKTKYNIPYIFYAHGLDITLPQKIYHKKKLMRKIIANASGIVANSNFTKDELVKLGANPEKIIVVYPCPNLEPEQISEWIIKEIKEAHELIDKKIILTVGRLVKRKGHDMVIKALPDILKRVPDAIYVIVGNGPYRKKLERLVGDMKLGNHVKFVGEVPDNQLKAYYEISDVFVMPARQLENGDVEGLGIVYLEANAFSKPVIGGRSGGVPEAILDNRTGILVDPLDEAEIANQTTKLLQDKTLAERLGIQGLERISEFFDWRFQTAKIKEILK